MVRPGNDQAVKGNLQEHALPEPVSVRIYDREYVLRTSEDARRLAELCGELDRRMREIASSSGSVDTLKVAILTAISIIDELARARDALQRLDETLSRRSLQCVTMLDHSLFSSP